MTNPSMEIGPSAGLAGPDSTVPIPVKEEKFRSWRVGSLSMGLSLLFLGVLLLISAWQGAEVFVRAMAWWPIVFVLLGLEIVTYTLWFRGKGKMHYDVWSIFFVGMLALCCLVFAGLGSLGLTQEIRRVVSSEQSSYALPEWNGTVPEGVKQVIIQGSEPYRVKVDRAGGTELNIFGSYSSAYGRLNADQEAQLLKSKRAGDTLYILLGDTPKHAFDHSGGGLDVTAAAPENLKVIVRDNHGNEVTR